MMRRPSLVLCSVLLVTLAACSEPPPAVVVVIDGQIPDTTTALSIEVSGTVVRSPIDNTLPLRVTVTGGAAEVSTVANLHGLFSIEIPLLPNTTNQLVFVGNDGLGNSSSPRTHTIVQQAPSPAAPKWSTAR